LFSQIQNKQVDDSINITSKTPTRRNKQIRQVFGPDGLEIDATSLHRGLTAAIKLSALQRKK
jgi:hypothetical protein